MTSGRLVVVGDSVLDRDVSGTADRLCPDAPVPVLAESGTVERPGGAGLAALLAAGDGYQVSLVTAIAADPAGRRLRELLATAGVAVYGLPVRGSTPEKIRLRAAGQVLLRHDRGQYTVDGPVPDIARTVLREAAAVLVSDYRGGVVALPAMRELLASRGATGGSPVVWDPHRHGPVAVPGTRLVTPNESELASLVAWRPHRQDRRSGNRLATVARDAAALREQWQAGAVAATLGADGALLCHAGPTPLVVPAPGREPGDSCGAGDRFAATAAEVLASGGLVSEAVQQAVARATEFVAAGGPAQLPYRTDAPAGPAGSTGWANPPGRPAEELVAQVRARGGTVVASGGCFDLLHAGHVATLQAARRLGDCLVVCLNSDRSVRAQKGPGRPLSPHTDRGRVLSALGCVDAVVVFDEPTPEAVLDRLRPDVWVKGGDYADDSPAGSLPESALIRRWGGQAVVVPYLPGHSTSSLVAAARIEPMEKGDHR